MNFINNKHFFSNHETKVFVLKKRIFFCFASRTKLNYAETEFCRFFFQEQSNITKSPHKILFKFCIFNMY